MPPIDGATRWWTVPVNVAATVAWRLPGALMGVVLVVVAGSMLGPPGFLLAVLWLVAGLVTLPRFGERLLARTVLRYRPAPGSWLEAEVRRLLPGRRVDVYVVPKASGVFALGGHTIGLGEASLGAGAANPALLMATAAAVDELRRDHPARAAADVVGCTVVGRQADPPTPGAAPVAAADQDVGGPPAGGRDRQQRPRRVPLRRGPDRLRGYRPVHHRHEKPPTAPPRASTAHPLALVLAPAGRVA